MRKLLRPPVLLTAASALLLFIGSPVRAHEEEKETSTLSFKSAPKWTINLPKEAYLPVSKEIPITHAGGTGFLAEMDGTALAVDTNGDGKTDTKAKGTAGFMTLKAKAENGREMSYAVRLVNQGGWKFAASGFMVGKVKGTAIRLVDQNNNGKYNDYGADAMLIGSGDAAAFLSRVVNLNGELFNLEVSADGVDVTVSPYTGQTGTLNLAGSFTTQGTLESAVVSSTDGDFSFNLAGEKKGILVPASAYTLAYGTVTQGSESVRIRPGKMKKITVGANALTSPAWGGPITAEFKWTHADGVLTIKPEDLFFFGNAGEEYYNWVPDGQPPAFVVKNAKNGQELLKARFGGC